MFDRGELKNKVNNGLQTLDQQYIMKKDARTGMTPSSFLILISTLKKTTEMTKKVTVRRRWKMSQWSRNHLNKLPCQTLIIYYSSTLHLFHLFTPTMRRKLTRTPRHIPITTPDTSNLVVVVTVSAVEQ